MGSVWAAEQTAPVRRKVALKLIKAGMDSRSVLARFEAERQALALMDHPNIAKVLDGGLTESGRPYFVMEYVKGVPITEYCDATRLSVEERLNLIIHVCSALQHAHQKDIIHRAHVIHGELPRTRKRSSRRSRSARSAEGTG
jgi:serine/threonine protein kinase